MATVFDVNLAAVMVKVVFEYIRKQFLAYCANHNSTARLINSDGFFRKFFRRTEKIIIGTFLDVKQVEILAEKELEFRWKSTLKPFFIVFGPETSK